MKKMILLFFTLFFATAVFGQSEDEKAIRKVIDEEIYFANQCDYENWESLWLHEPNTSAFMTWPNRHWSLNNWTEISEYVKNAMSPENCEPREPNVKMWNFKYNISGDMAHVSFLLAGDKKNEIGNERFFILKKRKGDWKIENFGAVMTSFYKLQERKEMLSKFAGNWQIDRSTLFMEPAGKGFEFQENNFNCKLTDVGLAVDEYRKWENLVGEWYYIRHAQLVHRNGRNEMTVFTTGYNVSNWTHAMQGKATEDEEGQITISYFDEEDPSKVIEKTILQLAGPHTLKVTWKTINDKGEVTWKMKADFTKNIPTETINY